MNAAALAIPGRLNVLLLILLIAINASLLWAASHTSLSVALLCAVTYSYTANTTFSLLHEAVHGIFHRREIINRWAGRTAAAFFPTSFSIQRAYHLTHHRHNRSEFERFDYLQPGDSAWLKRAQWYCILTGVYWLISVLGLIVYLFAPAVLRQRALSDTDSQTAKQTASLTYLRSLHSVNRRIACGEILAAFTFQAALFYALDLSLFGWCLCYAAFALQWSSLQYADHAFSPLDSHDGAWDLRVNALVRTVFLNYHLHLTHHRNPHVPWVHLPRFASTNTPQPSYLRVWLDMWRGPRPLPATRT